MLSCTDQNIKLFKIKKKNKKRIGLLETKHGGVQTPVFMPIATFGAVRNLTGEELKNLGTEVILGNTYHLWLRPGAQVIKKAGGLHKFMNWEKPILTDSGGYQVFSLGAKLAQGRNIDGKLKSSAGSVMVSDAGVEFRDPYDGRKHFLTPEQSIQIQFDLGSDIIMVLDECPAFPCNREQARKAVECTTQWAKRCKIESQNLKFKDKKPLLFAIVQGSIYKDLRQRSAKELVKIGFDGYAIGGVAVGEPRKYLWDVLKWVLPLLPENKPRYLMGLGRPEEIAGAVNQGIDMFDCVIPTREARHGRIYKFQISKNKFQTKNTRFYETLQIANSKFARDFKPIDENCRCFTCRNYSRAYVSHLFKVKEGLGLRLAAIHNLSFYLDLMNQLRK